MPIYGENPFCSKRIKPGAIPFYFPEGITMDTLLEFLVLNGWCGQIIGPHGSGKSTLLAALVPRIREVGKNVLHLELQDGTKQLPIDDTQLEKMDSNTVLAIDGFEQLSFWVRRKIKNRSTAQHFGTIIIAHESYDYPDLYKTSHDLDVAKMLVAKLLQNNIVQISETTVEEHFHANGGNLREMLFSLYDVYETAFRGLDRRQ